MRECSPDFAALIRAPIRHPGRHWSASALFLLPVNRVPVIFVGLSNGLLALAPAVVLGRLCVGVGLCFDRCFFLRLARSLFLWRLLARLRFLLVGDHQLSLTLLFSLARRRDSRDASLRLTVRHAYRPL